jgi:hypothetical protein
MPIQQLNKKNLKKIVKILWVGSLSIPVIFFILICISQFRTIEIDGKGDSGHPRSLSHPFICLSNPSFTDRGILYYCDFESFVRRGYSSSYYLVRETKITYIYLSIFAILIPVTAYAFYPKQDSRLISTL